MASGNTSFTFTQKDMLTCSFSVFNDMRAKGELSDVTIRIKNRNFPAHRIILAAAIPYFKVMFTSNLKESKEREVTMEELDPAALGSLINFAYTAVVEITAENVQSLLMASEFLQLTQVKDSCCDFLTKRLDSSNVWNVRNLATSLNCVTLVRNTESYIRENFEAFSKTMDFLSLPFTFLNDVIRKDDLRVTDEETVFNAVLSWVKNGTERHKMLPDLLTGVRMTLLSPEFLIKKASKETLIMGSFPCRNLLDEAKHHHLLREEGTSSSCSFEVSERRYGLHAAYCVLIFGFNNSSGLTILKFVAEKGKNPTLITLLNDRSRSTVQHVTVLGDQIYVFRINNFESFNPHSLKWATLPFPSTYSNFSHVVACRSKIYCFGIAGDSFRSANFGNKIICFDKERNEWSICSNENFAPCGDDKIVIISPDNVYYFGCGRCGFHNKLYSLQTQIVTRINGMRRRRSAFGSAVLNGKIYVSGGTDGYSTLSSTEIYNPSQGCFTEASSMKIPRKNFSLVTYNNKLYAIGGKCLQGISIRDIECYDPDTDRWDIIATKINGQYHSVKAVVIPAS